VRQYRVGLVGEANYQQAIKRGRVGVPVDLVHEPENPHDSTAISARIPGGGIIGYVPRDNWIKRAMLDEQWTIRARIGAIQGEEHGNLGVVLDLVMLDDAEVEQGVAPVFQDTPTGKKAMVESPANVGKAVSAQPALLSTLAVGLLKFITTKKGGGKGRRR